MEEKGQELLTFLRSFDEKVELEIFADREFQPEIKYCIWVNVYAPWSVLRYLGYALMECKVFLQKMSWNSRNVPYYNPQIFDNGNVILYTQHISISGTRESVLHQDLSADRTGTIERAVEYTRRDEQQVLLEYFDFEEEIDEKPPPNIVIVKAIYKLGIPLTASPIHLFVCSSDGIDMYE